MALVTEIIKDSFREANLIPITQTPTLDEQAEALRLLNRFVKSLFGMEAGEKLQPYVVGTNNIATPTAVCSHNFSSPYYVPLNARLLVNNSSSQTVQLNPNPQDGSRLAVIDVTGSFNSANFILNGNGRKIDGSTTAVLSTAGIQKEWFYRAELGSWMTITDLVLTDTFPFPEEFDDMFVIGLAFRLNPRNGVSMSDESGLIFKRLMKLFKARYSQKIETTSEEGLLRLTSLRPYYYNRKYT